MTGVVELPPAQNEGRTPAELSCMSAEAAVARKILVDTNVLVVQAAKESAVERLCSEN